MGKVICGPCKEEFDNNDAYLAHVCPTSNTTPTDPAYLGKNFARISEKALERGAARQGEEVHPAEAAQAAADQAQAPAHIVK